VTVCGLCAGLCMSGEDISGCLCVACVRVCVCLERTLVGDCVWLV